MKRTFIDALMLTLMMTVVSACQDQEFYKQEYLNPIDENPGTTNGDGGTTNGDDGSTNGNGGSTTGDNGTTNGDDGSTNGNGGTTTGDNGTTNGDDGSTNGSGGTTTGDNGTTNGDDGSTNGNGGSTTTTGDGGSTTTTGDGGEPEPVLEDQQDVFTQTATKKKLDVLWVIDDSGSMGDDQASLAHNFDLFIQDFLLEDIDFHMAITTTDTSSSARAGKMVEKNGVRSIDALTSAKASQNPAKFKSDFKSMIQVGERGSGTERGLEGSKKFIERHENDFMRDDSYTVIVYVSDEEDQSTSTVDSYVSFIQSKKQNAGLVKLYSIVNINNPQCNVPAGQTGCGGHTVGYQRYERASSLTGGLTRDIRDNFAESLLEMGEVIVDLSTSFPLSKAPHDPNAIEVLVNDIKLQTGWSYNATSRTIVFAEDSLPEEGASIKIRYKVEQ